MMGNYDNIQVPVSRRKASASQFAIPVRDAIRDIDERISNGSFPTLVRKTFDSSVTNNATLQTDTELVAPLLANTFYRFDAGILYVGTSGGKFQFGFNGPAGASWAWTPDCLDSGITAASSGIIDRSAKFTASAVTCGVNGAATNVARPSGLIFMGPTDGNFVFKFAQATAVSGQSATLKSQSWLQVMSFT
jgi:hypothetical protein